MGLGVILVLMALLHSGAAAFLKSEAYFNGTAELPCQFSNSQNLSLNELVIFLQDQKKLVLWEFYLGRENFNNVDRKYMGRTSFDQNNWTLQLHRVRIEDEGVYQCIIHHKRPTGLVSLHQKDSELSVFANFTEPEIVQMSNVTGNSGVNLTCSSGQGYPRATKIYFLLRLENSTEWEHDGVMQFSQDSVTELYNVSIRSYIPFPDGVSNVTIFCVLKTKSMKPRERHLFSKPFIRVPSHPLPVPRQPSWITAALLISVVFVCGIGYLGWKKKKKQQASISNKETIRTKRKKNEEMEESMKIHVPKRNDEDARCAAQL